MLKDSDLSVRLPREGPGSSLDRIDPDDVTLIDRSSALVRGFREILVHHGAPDGILTDLDRQLHQYLDTSNDEKLWLKRSKYVCTFPFAKYLRNEQPPVPDSPFRPSGSLRKWIKNRMNSYHKKNTHLWYSWLQAKRASLPASDDFVEETYDDHLKSLTREDPGDEYAISAIFSDPTFEHVLRHVRENVRYAIRDEKRNSNVSRMSASSSACFERPRSGGGQQGRLRQLCGLQPTDCWGSNIKYVMNDFDNMSHTSELVMMKNYHHAHCNWLPVSLYNVTVELRRPVGLDLWSDLDRLAQVESTHSDSLRCCIQGVLEPFKVRVISKGEALPYYSSRFLQKILHSSLRKMPCFRLVGETLSPTHLLDLARKAIVGDEWFSVDYSAATDGLSWKYSSRILRYILDQEDDSIKKLALRVLGPHELHYPTECGPEWRGTQTNGQLMGSILSFPILCLANLGVYLVTTRLAQQGWSHMARLRHVLVNGDDMVYAANPVLWDRHIKVGRDVGLEMSVGKAYHHNEYLNINSTSVVYPIGGTSLPRQIDFLNVGLFFGVHKVQKQNQRGKKVASMNRSIAETVIGNANHILKGSLPGKECDLIGRFIHQNRDKILDETEATVVVPHGKRMVESKVHRNIFLPTSLGGMGVLPPIGWKFSIKRIDQVLAYNLSKEYPTLPKTTQLPLPGPEPESISGAKDAPHEKVLKTPDKPIFILRHQGRLTKKQLPRTGIMRYALTQNTLLYDKPRLSRPYRPDPLCNTIKDLGLPDIPYTKEDDFTFGPCGGFRFFFGEQSKKYWIGETFASLIAAKAATLGM
jgi:hypothetical protein